MTWFTKYVRRRSVLPGGTVLAIIVLCSAFSVRAQAVEQAGVPDRIEGLLIGSAIGDAAGGPVEFQPPVRHDRAAPLDSAAISRMAARFGLSEYIRVDQAAPYGPWRNDAPVGTVTDDTRFKMLFMRTLDDGGQSIGTCAPTADSFARELLNWHAENDGPFGDLPGLWLEEFALSARWILGERDPVHAVPPERQWGGIPTMAGQMPFLPVAALHAGAPEAAYLATWDVDFLDTGWARDMTAALVAGLAHALGPDATWSTVEQTMRSTDPYGFGRVPWVQRRVDHWLDEADAIARMADGRPDVLYALLESRLGAETWWEAHVPLVVVFAAAKTVHGNPLATMQLILEFGHDTDSYLQLAGAIIGALHGPDVFPRATRELVEARLAEDFGESTVEWANLLSSCASTERG